MSIPTPTPLHSAPTATMPYGNPSTWMLVHPSQPQATQPQPTFQPPAPPPSDLVQQLHHSPPTDPATTTPIQPPPAPQQLLSATTPPEPQCHMPEGVWQPYSAFPPLIQPSHQSPPQSQLALSDSPQYPQPHQQPAPLDPTTPAPNPTTTATGSQPSPSPSIASAPPATVTPDPTTGIPDNTVSPAQPSPHPPHSSRRHHHKGRRKTDHHRSGRHRHRRRRRRRHHSKATRHHSSSWRHRSPSTSTCSYTSTPSRSRSRQPIDLRPNTDASTADNTNTDTSKYPLTPVVRRPPNRWRPTQPFQTLPPKEQILAWLDFHADQLDTSNRPQHQYLANLLCDSNITYKDITDFRQYTYVKWNEATQQYDQFQYNAISLPFLSTKASTPSPPPVSRATSTHREVAHINAGHTGPVGNITNILRQGRFLPSTLHVANYPGFFAQGVRITHNQQHDQGEFARIIHNTWQLHKNTHSLIVTLLAWGAATKYTSGGKEQAMTLLHDHHGAVFHQKGRCWVIHPDHAIVKGLAWSINSTPPDL